MPRDLPCTLSVGATRVVVRRSFRLPAEQDADIEFLVEEYATIRSMPAVVEMLMDSLRQFRSAIIGASITA